MWGTVFPEFISELKPFSKVLWPTSRHMTGLQVIENPTSSIANINDAQYNLIKNEPILFQLHQLKTMK